MFGISFSEIIVIAIIALVVVGPQKLPGLLLSIGKFIAKIRRMTEDVRSQTGIDEILREEGIDGVRELRALLRGEVARARSDSQEDTVELDETQEFPPEGVDTNGALPDDLVARTPEDYSAQPLESANAAPSPADFDGAPAAPPPGVPLTPAANVAASAEPPVRATQAPSESDHE